MDFTIPLRSVFTGKPLAMFDVAILLLCLTVALLLKSSLRGSLGNNIGWFSWLLGRGGMPIVPYLPIVGKTLYLRRDIPIFVAYEELAKQFGEVFAIKHGSSYLVIVNGSSKVKEFLSKGHAVASRPLLRRVKIHNPQFLGLADIPYNSTWKEQRKFCLIQLRNITSSVKFDEILQSEVQCILTKLSETCEKEFDPIPIIQNSVSSIICQIVLGKSFENNDRSFGQLVNLVQESLQLTSDSALDDNVSWIHKFLQKSDDDKILKVRTELMSFIQRYIDESDSGNLKSDISVLHKFSEQMRMGDKESFTSEQRLYLLLDLFNAGSETSMLWLQWALLYMINNPDCQRKVHDELDRHGEQCILYKDSPNLPFTEAVSLEVHRKASVVPLSLPRTTIRDVTVGKYTIPSNTTVMTNLWSAHCDKTAWKNPREFDPENFLDKDRNVINKEHVMPFSLGSRRCVGEHLSKVTSFAFFGNMMREFTFLPPEGVDKLSEDGVFRITHAAKDFKLRAIPRFQNNNTKEIL